MSEMSLDVIMEKEKFNEVEKALVKHPMLSQADRIKIISEIKIAKSNDRQSHKIVYITWIILLIAAMESAREFGQSRIPSLVLGAFVTFVPIILAGIAAIVLYRN